MAMRIEEPDAKQRTGVRPSRAESRQAAREAERRAAVARRRRQRLVRWGVGIAIAAIAITGTYLYWTASPAANVARSDDPRITLVAGSEAPDFTLPSTAGPDIRLSDYTARQHVLLFFQEGVMCPPCWQQMRDLQADSAKLQALDVALVTLAVDPLPMLVDNAVRERVSGMALVSDANARVSAQYQTMYTSMMTGQRPGHTFVLIDRAGIIRWRRDFKEMYVPDDQVLNPVAQALGR